MGAHCNSMELVFLLMAGWWSLFVYVFCIRIRCCRLSWVIPDFLQFRAKTVPLAPYLVLIFPHSSSLRPLSSQPFTYIFILSFCSVLCLQNVSPLSPPHSSLSLTLHSQNFEWVYWWFWVNCGIPTPTITMPFIGWHSCHLTPIAVVFKWKNWAIELYSISSSYLILGQPFKTLFFLNMFFHSWRFSIHASN